MALAISPAAAGPRSREAARWLRADAALQSGRIAGAREDMRAGDFEGNQAARLRARLAMSAFGVKSVAIAGIDSPSFRRAYEERLNQRARLTSVVELHLPPPTPVERGGRASDPRPQN